MLAALVSRLELDELAKTIQAVARDALLLRTGLVEAAPLGVGSSRIGGYPDLPPDAPWPCHSSGKPLAFLAQLNLSNARSMYGDASLPSEGILQFFSVYGWQDEDSTDPQVPPGTERPDWTRIVYHSNADGLAPRETPAGVNSFPPASIEFQRVLTLPNHPHEPGCRPLLERELTGDQIASMKTLVDTFDEVQAYVLGYPAKHQLLGYADYVQDIPDFVPQGDHSLLFQLASDDHTSMCWGDGGYLYFWMSAAHRDVSDFSAVITDYQCF